MAEHDLVIRGGFVVDGSGEPGREADIAIENGCIAQVGNVPGAGAEEIDARGKLVAPGFVDTKITKVTTENEKRLQGTLQKIPARRLGTPEDMAGAALYLASPLASYVCGQTIIVDGGLSLS